MFFLKIPRELGEKVRRELIGEDALDTRYPILQEEGSVLLPVRSGFVETKNRSGKWKEFELIERESEPRPTIPKGMKEALGGALSEEEMEKLVSSFDIIGDIAIIEVPPELETPKHETFIGQAILDTNKNIKTVLKKLSAMEGEYRVRRLKCIAGIDKTETEYKENGVRMRLDVAKVYFSVRLAHERKRIAELTKEGENVLVLFAGVGPFAFVIGKTNKTGKIVAVELNPDAVRYIRKNITLNHSKNIIAEEGDARTIVLEKYRDFADRITMPLPKSAHEFLDVAFAGIKDGGMIHFYTIVDAEHAFENAKKLAKTAAEKSGVKIGIIGKRIVRPYSPRQIQVVLDIRVDK